jgi:hypothetical protein
VTSVVLIGNDLPGLKVPHRGSSNLFGNLFGHLWRQPLGATSAGFLFGNLFGGRYVPGWNPEGNGLRRIA